MNLKRISLQILLLVIPFFSKAQQAENQNAFPVQITISNGIIEGEFDIKTNIQSFKEIGRAHV